MADDDRLFLSRCLTAQGATREWGEGAGGVVTETRSVQGGMGSGRIGWSQWTKEARGDLNAPLTRLSWWRSDGSIATCHIIIHTGGLTRHSNSASMTDEKLPICKRNSLPLHSTADRQSSEWGCVSELNFMLWYLKSCSASTTVLQVMDRSADTNKAAVFSLGICLFSFIGYMMQSWGEQQRGATQTHPE